MRLKQRQIGEAVEVKGPVGEFVYKGQVAAMPFTPPRV